MLLWYMPPHRYLLLMPGELDDRPDASAAGALLTPVSTPSQEIPRQMDFQLVSDYKPRGDQGRAIEEILSGLAAGEQHQITARRHWLR